jgi:hypothetical protein
MSDIIWAALIGGGFSTVVAVAGSFATYKVAKLSSLTEDARLRQEARASQTQLEHEARANRAQLEHEARLEETRL